ncbi:FGGY-family carbohydrate kinase [Deinococcus aquatilis]|jgi:xylulokinase|uniref:FGGY-family carbohydrate kinase n=1 Tax=Deinococcus aquatilis TaxID=519440 RepID=UPI000370DCCA|nr:FGGY-family carbohydrate kinase [Deinococcus aquatilis]
MSPELLLGIDVGTYSSKGVLVTSAGKILRQHVIPHGVSFPAPGYAEQDADAVWWSDVQAIIAALLSGEYSGADVAGVALSAIGPTLLPLDSAGRPLRPGILYGVDSRAQAQIEALEAEIGAETIFAHSGMSLTSQAIGPKIRWLREQEPELWNQTATLTTASAYLTYRLTGRHIMDHHTASHSMPLYDPALRQWTPQFAVPVLGDSDLSRLPELGWSDELAGTVSAEAARLTGLREGTPVAVGAVDALSEALSVGVVNPGDLMIMYGSTTFFILVQDVPTPDPRVWTVGGAFAGQHNLAAGMGTSGSLTRWFADEFARDQPTGEAYDTLFAGAEAIAPGSDGLLVLPYFSGERTPINDPHARGVFAGMSLTHTRDHLFRAVLEGVGYGIRHNIEAFRDLGADVRRVVAVGGGAKTRTWLQIVSDISGEAQHLPATTVGASYGDAFLAGLAAGVLTRADLELWVRPAEMIQPNAALKPEYDRLYGLYRDLYTGTRDVVHALRGQS